MIFWQRNTTREPLTS